MGPEASSEQGERGHLLALDGESARSNLCPPLSRPRTPSRALPAGSGEEPSPGQWQQRHPEKAASGKEELATGQGARDTMTTAPLDAHLQAETKGARAGCSRESAQVPTPYTPPPRASLLIYEMGICVSSQSGRLPLPLRKLAAAERQIRCL